MKSGTVLLAATILVGTVIVGYTCVHVSKFELLSGFAGGLAAGTCIKKAEDAETCKANVMMRYNSCKPSISEQFSEDITFQEFRQLSSRLAQCVREKA